MLNWGVEMKTYKISVILCLFVTLLGCATGSYILTGESRPAISPDMVKIYLEPSSQYETIGIVEASSEVGFSSQAAQDRTISELKAQAAKIGANGVLFLDSGDKTGEIVGLFSGGVFYAGMGETKTAKGKAIFVIRE